MRPAFGHICVNRLVGSIRRDAKLAAPKVVTVATSGERGRVQWALGIPGLVCGADRKEDPCWLGLGTISAVAYVFVKRF